MADSELPDLSTIDRRFIQRLQAFASNGYKFEGSDHALKPGTQYEAFDGYLNGLIGNHRHGYFEVPTGVGKTAIFISLIENYLEAANGKEDGKRVLVVVPNITLVKQTANAFAKFMPEIAPRLEADDDSGHPIDWEKSQIGVQYSGLKHADKKPRVLITTYASLRKDKENKVYDPKEFGLVVYDEGHSITADESGKAVGKFKEALQLAVTATPDYDDDEKRVGKKLAHCYYRLPLAEAINRGDLCGVRPILIKTDYTVDAAKVEEYLNANDGRPLTDAQLQNLFNVEARNRSVIDTYLADRDPDSGERFLGQQGLIFSGGITHANDLVEQFHNALGEERFANIRRWLEDEKLEVAAAIHSGAKGAWLRPGLLTDENGVPLPDRKRQAQSEWYSEDEVRKLHEEGKILLLISDKKLREGYDCPKDSIVIDMIDRLSVVDVTQRFGRGFRLDPDDPDKVCTPINLVDANTHDIYKDRPQMLPIYAAEILEGAEFRKPMKRQLTRKFNHDIPEAEEALDHGKFEVISDPERIRHVAKTNKDAKKAIIPWLPDDKLHWFTGERMMKEMSISPTKNRENLDAVLETMMADPNRIVEIQGQNRTLGSMMGRYRFKGIKNPEGGIYVDPDLLPLVGAAMGFAPRLPDDKQHWVTGGALLRVMSIGSGNDNMTNLSAVLEQMFATPNREVEIDGQIHTFGALMGRYRHGPAEGLIYVDPRLGPIICKAMGFVPGLPKDKEHWITAVDLLKTMSIENRPETKDQISVLLEQFMADPERQVLIGEQTRTLGSMMGRYRNRGTLEAIFVDPELAPIFSKAMGYAPRLPAEKENWLTNNGVLRTWSIKVNEENHELLNEVLAKLLATPERREEINGQICPIGPLMGHYRNGSELHPKIQTSV